MKRVRIVFKRKPDGFDNFADSHPDRYYRQRWPTYVIYLRQEGTRGYGGDFELTDWHAERIASVAVAAA